MSGIDVERLARALDAVPGLGYRMVTGTCFWHKRYGCSQCRPVEAVDASHEQAEAIAAEYDRLTTLERASGARGRSSCDPPSSSVARSAGPSRSSRRGGAPRVRPDSH